MSSEDEDYDEDREEVNENVSQNIASSLLFGNIDNEGRLTDADDIFDRECQRHLASLQSHLSSVVPVASLIGDGESDSQDKEDGSALDNNDYTIKLENAVDYSDIADAADDDEILAQLESLRAEFKATKEDMDDDYDSVSVPPSKPSDSAVKTEVEETKAENFAKDKDGFVIPKPINETSAPPASPPSAESASKDEEAPATRVRTDSGSSLSEETKRKLDTPLAAMLPSKYANSDVTELFPEFRHNQVLRFSRLFGPGKSTSRPQIWKSVRNRRKSHRQLFENKLFIVQNQANASLKEDWKFNATPIERVPLEMIEEDDEVKLLTNDFAVETTSGSKASDNSEIAEWRFGPAQIWYDMLKVPDNGEGFDYGFKLKKDKEDFEDEDENKSNAINRVDDDDAFLMVTQANWEADVIWDGEDVRQEVLAKLNDKNLASGWLPSGNNRTASAFTQQMRATSGGVGGGGASSKPLPTPAQQSLKKDNKKSTGPIKETLNEASNSKNSSSTWYSIFPIENEELIFSNWEDNVIWDAENMDRIPSPKLLTLDRNDDNIILDVPVDVDQHELERSTPSGKEKKDQIRKSRLLLGKAGVIAEPELMAPPSPPSNEKDPYNISNDEYYQHKVPVAALKAAVGNNLIQHSIPALELRQPFFPTHLGYQRLQQFHRQPLKRYSHGKIADTLSHGVNPLVKYIKHKAKAREQERINSGGGKMFFMRTPEDLTGKDGDLILSEYSEEHPPLIMQVGMASKIKNYYRRKAGKDTGAPIYKYGETVYTHNSPFLGNLTPGQSLQALENNLFRAPIYEHRFPETDFLVIRTRDSYHIRSIDTIFTVGQELPVYEVPGPNSKKANNFIRDFLQVFIYRLFWSSKDMPKRIKMEDIKKAFPSHSESSIRKRLKQCADFKRTGMDSNWWVLKSDFRLPSEDEIRAMVSPEACCAYYSMLAAEQRLKDAGYGEKSMFAPDDAEDEDLQVKMDDEVKAAPWNTTRAFISAMKSKCLLQLTGVADPTGCGEGFSYVRIPNKPTQTKEEQQQKETIPKKTVTGTDADLRRLPLTAAKNLLRKFGVPDEEIKKLSRWEVIDVVRTLSTKQAKQADGDVVDDDAMSKFARGNRFSIAEHQERYKEECQRIFELQNRVLASNEDLSTDEDESEEEEDSDLEEMGKNIELMLASKKTIVQMNQDKEEEERRELKKMLYAEDSNYGGEGGLAGRKKKEGDTSIAGGNEETSFRVGGPGRILKIHRTFTDAEGNDVVRIEIVRKPAVIDTYVRIRTTKDDAFIKQFACALDDQQKEERRKERRRIQEQQRRAKRNQEREKFQNSMRQQIGLAPMSGGGGFMAGMGMAGTSGLDFTANAMASGSNQGHNSTISAGGLDGLVSSRHAFAKDVKVKKGREKKLKENLKLKCGACGGVGHMRTNRACPLYGSDASAQANAANNASTGDASSMLGLDLDENNTSTSMASTGLGLLGDDSTAPVKMDENKLILSKSIIKQLEEERMARDAKESAAKMANLKLKIPKEVALSMKRKKRAPTTENTDYLLKPDYKLVNRRRTDPLVTLSDIFEEVLNETKNMPESALFEVPVLAKDAPTYHAIIEKPMDLQTIRQNIRLKLYKSREDFLRDVGLIVANSEKYNGSISYITLNAKTVAEKCAMKIAEKEDEIIRLEKLINPLLDDDLVAFSYILKTIVSEKLKTLPESWPFHKPVNKKAVKNYYEVIERPIDLETIELKAAEHQYRSREEFLSDLMLMHENSAKFNGPESPFTAKAAEMIGVANEALMEIDEQLTALEHSIRQVRAGVDDEDYNSNFGGEEYFDGEFDDDEDGPPPASRRRVQVEESDNANFAPLSSSNNEQLEANQDGEEMEDDYDGGDGQWEGGQQESSFVPQMAADEDFDADYDPSDFLFSAFGNPQPAPTNVEAEATAGAENEPVDVTKDLDVSDSDVSEEEEGGNDAGDAGDDVWF